MKKTSTILAIGSALALTSGASAIESSFHVGYSTDYVWRGVNQAADKDGLYEYGLDFTGDCNCGATWNAGIWQADYGTSSEELDLYASISKEIGAFEVSLGLIRYEFGTAGGDTTELALGAGTEIAGLDVAASIYYDVDANDGAIWGEVSVGKSYDLGGGAALDLAANFGSTLDAQGGENYTTYGISAAVSKEIGENLTGRIYVAAENTDGHPTDGDDLWGGLSLSYGF
ncbi:MAG: TorF family putative porin [Akkermansiaceae bacterium]|nr:hypothetical protein [Akkermansiaceae bacterium]